MQEGVLLAHALVARLAEQAGARVLFIKGPTAVALGVRPDRPSTDVDVLVDPADFRTLCAAFDGAGWQVRTPAGRPRRAADLAFDHSTHYVHRDWPSDVDLHYNFPGFLAPPEQVFEGLWARRTTVTVAGRQVPTPDALGQALVVGLHALRDPKRPRSIADLDHVARSVTDPADGQLERRIAELAGLAHATGAEQTAEPLLHRLGVRVVADEPQAQLLAWRQRQEFGEAAGSLWLVEFSQAPWYRRPGVLARAALPPREVLMSSHLAGDATRRQVLRLHVQRWARGVARLPRSVAIIRGLRRSGRA